MNDEQLKKLQDNIKTLEEATEFMSGEDFQASVLGYSAKLLLDLAEQNKTNPAILQIVAASNLCAEYAGAILESKSE
jgi:hypothetical protein